MTHFVANPVVVNDVLVMMVPILDVVNVTTCLVLINDDGHALTVVAVSAKIDNAALILLMYKLYMYVYMAYFLIGFI